MKPKKLRKLQRELANSHNVRRGEIERITNAQKTAYATFDPFRKIKNYTDYRTARRFSGK